MKANYTIYEDIIMSERINDDEYIVYNIDINNSFMTYSGNAYQLNKEVNVKLNKIIIQAFELEQREPTWIDNVMTAIPLSLVCRISGSVRKISDDRDVRAIGYEFSVGFGHNSADTLHTFSTKDSTIEIVYAHNIGKPGTTPTHVPFVLKNAKGEVLMKMKQDVTFINNYTYVVTIPNTFDDKYLYLYINGVLSYTFVNKPSVSDEWIIYLCEDGTYSWLNINSASMSTYDAEYKTYTNDDTYIRYASSFRKGINFKSQLLTDDEYLNLHNLSSACSAYYFDTEKVLWPIYTETTQYTAKRFKHNKMLQASGSVKYAKLNNRAV